MKVPAARLSESTRHDVEGFGGVLGYSTSEWEKHIGVRRTPARRGSTVEVIQQLPNTRDNESARFNLDQNGNIRSFETFSARKSLGQAAMEVLTPGFLRSEPREQAATTTAESLVQLAKSAGILAVEGRDTYRAAATS
jgi:hypothetical protein